ncbi:Threonine aldolase, partial [Trichostrongylus colubriformis]
MVSKPPAQYTTTVANSSQYIDMRSDTVTLPSEEMKQAMVNALLGDDVYGEDRTVNELEARCAELFGKEAGLFVVSGTMGNLLAIMAHCQRGDEIIVGKHNHIHRWEQGNYAQLAGVSATTIDVD